MVAVDDPSGKRLGHGLWHTQSAIAVRMLPGCDDGVLGPEWLKARLEAAVQLRKEHAGLPDEQHSAYRLVHAEGDSLPGLLVDVFGDVLAIGYTSFGMWQRRELVLDALEATLSPRAIVEVEAGAPTIEGIPIGPRVVRGELEDPRVLYRENGLELEARLPGGQKTGAYLDQRLNRSLMAAHSHSRSVLDLYCYHAGFAINALAAGAHRAVAVDASGPAIKAAREDAIRNGVESKLELLQEDVIRYLKSDAHMDEPFDVVILDPPPMSRSRAHREQALKAYTALHRAALPRLKAGGLLLTCSCSSAIDHIALERVLVTAAREAERTVQVLQLLGAGPDHPVRLPCVESRYLSAILCRVN